MNPVVRTLAFVGAAVLSLGAAGLTYYSSLPVKVDWSAEIGEQFFPDFTDPNTATSLQVASFDREASKTNTFSVEFKDGKWRIPSHNNYPADGKERLKQTAASVIGITRGTLAGKTKEAHKLHNLLDPLDDKLTETQGRGDRITLKNGDKVLVDFIIGKKKEGSENTFYLRRADEERFFLSEVKIDLSTKFSDWIEPDLLDLKRDDIKEIYIDRYSVDEVQGAINEGVQSLITRDNATADWKINGIDEAQVKPKTSVISAMLGSFDDLKIVGVRRKPEGLSASLAADESMKLTNSTRLDLQNRGFFYHPKKGIVSNEGDMIVTTFDGVTYVLRFGEVFTGSDVEIEAGGSSETAQSTEAKKEEAGSAAPKEAPPTTDEKNPAAEESTVKKNRYVFITAQFDEEALGTPPVAPQKPEEPKAEAAPAADAPPADPAAPKPDPKTEHEAAMKKFETDSDVYRIKKKEYDDRKSNGEKKVKALNARFADWYYVISEDLFDELRVKPEDLVEPKTAETPGAGGAESGLPVVPPLPNVPQGDMPAEGQPPAEVPAEGEKPAAPAEGEKPAESPPSEPTEKPAEGEKSPAEPAKPAEGDTPAPAAEAEKPAAETPTPPPAEGEKPAEPAAPAAETPAPAEGNTPPANP